MFLSLCLVWCFHHFPNVVTRLPFQKPHSLLRFFFSKIRAQIFFLNFSSSSFLHSIPFLLFCRQIPAAAGIVCIRESGDLCDSPTMENGRSVTHTDYHPSDFHFFWIFSSAPGTKRIVTHPVFLAWKCKQKLSNKMLSQVFSFLVIWWLLVDHIVTT